jgi:hypothetical protein
MDQTVETEVDVGHRSSGGLASAAILHVIVLVSAAYVRMQDVATVTTLSWQCVLVSMRVSLHGAH